MMAGGRSMSLDMLIESYILWEIVVNTFIKSIDAGTKPASDLSIERFHDEFQADWADVMNAGWHHHWFPVRGENSQTLAALILIHMIFIYQLQKVHLIILITSFS